MAFDAHTHSGLWGIHGGGWTGVLFLINIFAGSKSEFIYETGFANLRLKGRMTSRQKLIRRGGTGFLTLRSYLLKNIGSSIEH